MAQPYDYSINVPNPTAGFLQGMQIGQAMRAQEAERQKAQAAAQRAQLFRQRVLEIRNNPSPDQIDKLYFDFPEMKEQLDVFSARISEADKRTYGDFSVQAILARQAGKSDEEVAAIYRQAADAAKASGRNDLFQQFSAAAETAKNPEGNDDLAARILLNKLNPDVYKMIYAQTGGDTTFIKELVAEGLTPGTPEFKEALRTRRTQERFTGVVPGYGFYSGSVDGLSRILSGSPAPSGPAVGSVVSGYRFKGGDPKDKTNWEKVEGGQTGARSSGNFRER
jgi:hypothetical protein